MIDLKDAIHELNHHISFEGADMLTEGECVIYLKELQRLHEDIEAGNKPLTIGELYSMRNKPVWLVYPIGEASRWTLLAMILDESMIYDSTHFVFEGTKRRYVLDVEDYGKKWLPYRTEQAARAAMEAR
jgi:hypothetical protein